MDISVTDLTVVKNGVPVVQIPGLRFPTGSTTAVFGPNGSGKTTLLRAIAGLEQTSSGQVRVGGVSIGREPRARRLVGMAFQRAVFLRGTVGQNLDLALRLREVPPAERQSRIEEAARECGLVDLLNRSARHLSAGEGQRVNLARVLALRPAVTLLDEPLAGVDRIARIQLLTELPGLLARFTQTTILVTHDREEAFRLADRLVILIEGKVKAAGTKTAVYAHPPDRAAAELLGYTVVSVDDTLLAVPAGGFKPGDGSPGFTLAVERVIEVGNHFHVVGKIHNDRIDMRLPPGAELPTPGANLRVHAGPHSVRLEA